MNDQTFKQIYAFFSYILIILWAVFCVWMTWRALDLKGAGDILTTAGANLLLGAMLGWHSNIIQFFFRKAAPEKPDNPK